MPLRYNLVIFSTAGTFSYTPPANLYGLEAIVRGGGGGGAAGRHDTWGEGCWPGPGGAGGGCSVTPRVLRRDELPETGPIQVRVGAGGNGAAKVSNDWRPGGDGGASWFGDYLYAGGGMGGGRIHQGDYIVWSLNYGATGGYGAARGGRGLHYDDPRGEGWFWDFTPYRFSPADATNAAHMAAGGGGGGHGYGFHIRSYDDDGDPNYVYHQERHGGSSGATENHKTAGAAGRGSLPHWQTLQSGCGGNGGRGNGGNGGFPSGGGAGGAGSDQLVSTGNGGNGARGCVTVIELLQED